jgi:hypothetical protein
MVSYRILPSFPILNILIEMKILKLLNVLLNDLIDRNIKDLNVAYVNLRSGSLGMAHLNDEVYGSNGGRCPVFIHDLPYSP